MPQDSTGTVQLNLSIPDFLYTLISTDAETVGGKGRRLIIKQVAAVAFSHYRAIEEGYRHHLVARTPGSVLEVYANPIIEREPTVQAVRLISRMDPIKQAQALVYLHTLSDATLVEPQGCASSSPPKKPHRTTGKKTPRTRGG